MAIQNVKSHGDVASSHPTNAAAAAESTKSQKTGKPTSAAKEFAKTPTPTVSDAANVQISPRAKEMSMARKIAEETPDVDESKIEKYKNMISRGEYKPDAGKIADGMAREALLDEYATNRG